MCIYIYIEREKERGREREREREICRSYVMFMFFCFAAASTCRLLDESARRRTPYALALHLSLRGLAATYLYGQAEARTERYSALRGLKYVWEHEGHNAQAARGNCLTKTPRDQQSSPPKQIVME